MARVFRSGIQMDCGNDNNKDMDSMQVRGGPNDEENANVNVRTSNPPPNENNAADDDAPAVDDAQQAAENVPVVDAAPAAEDVYTTTTTATTSSPPATTTTTPGTISAFTTVTPGSMAATSLFKRIRFDVAKRKCKCHGNDCGENITKGCIRIQHQVSGISRIPNKTLRHRHQLHHYHVPCWLQKKTITVRADFDRYANFSTFPLETRQALLQATTQSSKDIRIPETTEAAASSSDYGGCRTVVRIRMSPPPAPKMPPKRCLGTMETTGDRCRINSDIAFTSSSNLPMPERQYAAGYLLREGYYTCGNHLHQWIPKDQMDAEDARIRDALAASTKIYNQEMQAYNTAQEKKKAASYKTINKTPVPTTS